ncbi:hypothetical protein CEP51_016662, partial [Fusarium floridanum]
MATPWQPMENRWASDGGDETMGPGRPWKTLGKTKNVMVLAESDGGGKTWDEEEESDMTQVLGHEVSSVEDVAESEARKTLG